jgi:hypothetical protein
MESEAPKDPGECLKELASKLRAWDGKPESAAALRKAVRELPPIQRKPADAAEGALLKARSGYEKRKGLGDPQALSKDPERLALLAPFIGDPELGSWAFHDPLLISDEDAVAWLPIVGRHAPPDENVRRFVRVMFRARPRTVWVPASRAFAELARRDDAAREALKKEWGACFPEGLPPAWKDTLRGHLPKTPDAGIDAHRPRHLLHAVASWVALGGDTALLPGYSVEKFSSMKLPKDDADASALLLAWKALIGGEGTRPKVLPLLRDRLEEVKADEMSDQVLRDIADGLRSDPSASAALAALESRLRKPLWTKRSGAKQLDTLWSWLETARWFHSRGDSASVREMEANAGESSAAFRLIVEDALPGGAPHPVDALLPRLSVLLDPHVAATTAERSRNAALAELFLLLQSPAVAEFPWKSLVARAVGRDAADRMQDGPVKDVARADIALAMQPGVDIPALLLRDAVLPEKAVVRLASTVNGFVARQVAVQLERLLREAGTGTPQVRLLWSVLRNDPHDSLFEQLLDILRGEPGKPTRLHEMVAALRDLHEQRVRIRSGKGGRESPETSELKGIAAGYLRLAEATAALIEEGRRGAPPDRGAPEAAPGHAPAGNRPASGDGAPGPDRRPEIRDLARAVEATCGALEGPPSAVGTESWLLAVRELLVGRDSGRGGPGAGPPGGVEGWMKWLGFEVEDMEAPWTRFAHAVKAVASAKPALNDQQEGDLRDATAALRDLTKGLAWPEVLVLRKALGRTDAYLEERREEARRSRQESERLDQALDVGDEERAVEIATDPEVPRYLTSDDLNRLGRFLLDRWRFRVAHRLRNRVAGRALIPPFWSYLAPLLTGVAAGAFLLLDMGTDLNRAILLRGAAPGIVMVVAALALSFTLLVIGFPSARKATREETRSRRIAFLCRRALPLYAGCLALSTGISAALLWMVSGTDLRPDGTAIPFASQAILWGSLSLFLGLFLGLMLQGRRFAKEE